MANKGLFSSQRGSQVPPTDIVNEAGGKAYAFGPEHALAQYAVTGCLNGTFYAQAEQQLDAILAHSGKVSAEFVGQTALYAREHGYMKDVPALLCAHLASRGLEGLTVLKDVFPRVIDNGKMLRNFVQILRSGAVGRKSFGTAVKKLIWAWLDQHDDEFIYRNSIGSSPSFGDILKMVHHRPRTVQRDALYKYLLGKECASAQLPAIVRQFEMYKASRGVGMEMPKLPFEILTGLDLDPAAWADLARGASWTATRMNLNTFTRHDVWAVPGITKMVAERLRDPALIEKSRAFPYQLLAAFVNAGENVPHEVREALQDAMEIAVNNVPTIDGQVIVLPDVSGSMSSPVTGHREGSTTKVNCIHVAALVAAAVLRKNPSAIVLPFEEDVVDLRLNPRDSIMTNAQKLSSIGGGGTSCSAPLVLLNRQKAKGDLVLYVSDNQSWVDEAHNYNGTRTMVEWSAFRERNPRAKMVCIDIQAYGSTQAQERGDILNVGGFSDRVFDVVDQFAKGTLSADHWVGKIKEIKL